MISTRLICIDGMPGAGKSTTSQRLCLHLLKQGYDARWCYEHGPDSPIWRGAERFDLMELRTADAGAVRQLILSRWRAFVAQLRDCETIVIMESSLLHTTIGVMLGADLEEGAILESIREVNSMILGLKPVSIYLAPDDVDRALKTICAQRKYDQFELPLTTLLSKSRYVRARELEGFEAVAHFFRHSCALASRVFETLPMLKLRIDNSTRAWAKYEREITDFLKLPRMPPLSEPVAEASRFVGRYRSPRSEAQFVVAADAKGLYLDDARGTRLMHDRGEVFYVNGIWLALQFKDLLAGSFQRLELHGHLPDAESVFYREHQQLS